MGGSVIYSNPAISIARSILVGVVTSLKDAKHDCAGGMADLSL